MPLSPEQVDSLNTAIAENYFPAVYFDFLTDAAVADIAMAEVEQRVRDNLLDQRTSEIKNGLSNVWYWGFAQRPSLATFRVNRFRSRVTTEQLQQFSRLLAIQPRPALTALTQLKLPEFSKMSFVSKVRMFLDPVGSAVLDRQIMKIPAACPGTVLDDVRVSKTSIPITEHNSHAYERWCNRLRDIARHYLGGTRAVDVERGLFHLVQTNRAEIAGRILRDA